jgi:prophage regulatory protein
MSATVPHPTTTPYLLRLPVVLSRTGLGRTLAYELMSEGRFPVPVKLSGRAVAWPSDEIDAWITERIVGSDGEATL